MNRTGHVADSPAAFKEQIMRKLVIQMQVTLDGFVGAPDGDVTWAFPDFSDDAVQWIVDHISDVGAHLMGRSLYHDMAGHWPTSTEPYAPPMNDIPKIVFSSTLKTADWKETTIVSGDLVTEVKKLKEPAGKGAARPRRRASCAIVVEGRARRRVSPADPSGRARRGSAAVRLRPTDAAQAGDRDDIHERPHRGGVPAGVRATRRLRACSRAEACTAVADVVGSRHGYRHAARDRGGVQDRAGKADRRPHPHRARHRHGRRAGAGRAGRGAQGLAGLGHSGPAGSLADDIRQAPCIQSPRPQEAARPEARRARPRDGGGGCAGHRGRARRRDRRRAARPDLRRLPSDPGARGPRCV